MNDPTPHFTAGDVEVLKRETPFQGFFRLDRLHLRHRLHLPGRLHRCMCNDVVVHRGCVDDRPLDLRTTRLLERGGTRRGRGRSWERRRHPRFRRRETLSASVVRDDGPKGVVGYEDP